MDIFKTSHIFHQVKVVLGMPHPNVALDTMLVGGPVGEGLKVIPDSLVLGMKDVSTVFALLDRGRQSSVLALLSRQRTIF